MFENYYRELVRRSGRVLPHVDEARRDYLSAIRMTVDGMMGMR